jgi:hypothetical protein
MESGLARAIKYPARLRNEVFPGVRDVCPVIMMEPVFVGRILGQGH